MPEYFKGCERTCRNVTQCEHVCLGYRAADPVRPDPVTVRAGAVVCRGRDLRETVDRALDMERERKLVTEG